jgi:hypothetical protein
MKAPRPLPTFAFYERLAMRALFAWVVFQATPKGLMVSGIPSPNGFARVVDLHFLLAPHVFAFCQKLLAISLVLYVLRLVVWLALPVALFIHVGANALTNSQGGIQHAMQIVSLALLAQTVAHFYGLWRRRAGEDRALLESRAIWWSQQTIVAVYLVAGITKLMVTKGKWIADARWLGVSIAKSAYMSFYDTHSQTDLQQQLAVAHFAAVHGWLMLLIAAVGLFLELGSPLMLINRIWAAAMGCALIGFHVGLTYSMGLSFIYNQWLLLIFMVNPPYWIVTAGEKIFRSRPATSP